MRGCLTLSACLAASTALASSNSGIPDAAQALLDTYPGLKVHMQDGRVWSFYGQKMTAADTPAQAVEWWIADHGDAFGIADLDLQLERTNAVSPQQTWTVFAHKQYMDGLPVEFGYSRMVVANGSPNTVILVSGKLATPPVDGFAAVNLDADQALAFAQSYYAELTVWGTPELVVYYGQDDTIGNITPVKTWKIRGENTLEGYDFKAETMFINATDGSITFIRNEKYYADVLGQVHGMGTPWGKDACRPDIPENPPTDLVMGDVQVDVNGVLVQSLDEDGSFLVAGQGDVDATVFTDLIGPYSRIFNDNAGNNDELQVDVPFTVGQENVDVFYNPAPSEFTTSQVNAHLHANITHDYYTDHQPGFTLLGQIQNHANVSGSCNAFFSGTSINFYKAQDPDGSNGCPNMAYSSVVAHEYGHYVVDRHFLSQGSFGEGYSDAIGAMIYDDPITARDFFKVGEDLRNPIEANQQYPCSQEIHTCGMVLSGIWWDINLNLEPVIGDQETIDLLRQRFTDWTEITIGGIGNDAMHPTSVPEVLTVFDDDADLETPGPYDTEICSAFVKHGIVPCGDITILEISFPNGSPGDLTGIPCDVESKICIKIADGSLGQLEPGTANLVYRNVTDGGAKTTVALADLGGDLFEATLPALADGKVLTFWFEAETTDGTKVTEPAGAPGNRFTQTYSCEAPAIPGCDVGGGCEGDVNADGIVDPLDSGYSQSRFGCSVGTGDAECDAADANADGVVDPLDVGYILSRFGACP